MPKFAWVQKDWLDSTATITVWNRSEVEKTGKTSKFKPGKVFSDATLSSVNRTIEKCLSYTNFVFVQSWYHQNLLQSHLEQCHSSNDIRKVTDCRRPCHTPARCSNDEVK